MTFIKSRPIVKIGLLAWVIIISCAQPDEQSQLFKLKDSASTGISFSNNLIYDKDFNVYKYRNFYNGGGVSIGDINNDGLADLYLTANQDSNRLYLNRGNWKFEDITASSKTYGAKAWSTGVTMTDINADGYLDIYVCNSGDLEGDDKENELFINNGDLTFTEAAEKYNLNDAGYSTHASFFDYDKDGDLDVYILNNSYQAIGSFNLKKNERPKRDMLGGDKLMQNNEGIYKDVSEAAGIYGSVIGFGLGVTVGDVNNDNWEDIFVSNDFFERDYLYINQKDGTFKDDLTNQMMSISGASMGADLADIDNDGYGDIFVTEMLPYEYDRLKTVTTFESWDKYSYNVQNDYHHQFTRNTLHYNNGNNSFSEISRLANVAATDWSWGALFFDMDNDGLKDLFVANGIYRDLTNQDYLQYVANEEVIKSIVNDEGVNYRELIDMIPSNKIKNQAFKNKGNLEFEIFENSGLNLESFSNGAAYGDLDNDGDLDLVVNNVNMPLFVFENQLQPDRGNYIKLELKGSKLNNFGIGAKIIVKSEEDEFYYEHQPTRGFQSSMDLRPNIGVGMADQVDITIIWPTGEVSEYAKVKTNQLFTVSQSDALKEEIEDHIEDYVFKLVDNKLNFTQQENQFVDFNRERLLYHMRSNEGPKIALGDLNNDGINDIVIPEPKGIVSKIFLSTVNGYTPCDQLVDINKYKESEHVKSILFDADGDDDLDIYFASGSVELSPFSPLLFDVIYFNEGNNRFVPSQQKLPNGTDKISTGAVAFADADNDGDNDLFVGERIKIGSYGTPGSGYLLINDGKGEFVDMTTEIAPKLVDVGMITDATFTDLDNDGDKDLLIVGEFMEVMVFVNNKGHFEEKTISGIPLKGWWKTIETIDIDNDGDEDLVLGNHGLNSRFKASVNHPIRLYYNDFDKNGFTEGILTFNAGDNKDYPYALRHDLIEQLKELRKRFPDFESFKNASIDQIFSEEELQQSRVSEVNNLKTTLLINQGNLQFKVQDLPAETQFSPIYAIEAGDFDADGDMDLVMGGNLFRVKPEMGIYDASHGVYLENNGQGEFLYHSDGKGFFVRGEIRDLKVDNNELIVIRSGDEIMTFQFGSE